MSSGRRTPPAPPPASPAEPDPGRGSGCARARATLLAADPAALAGEKDSELGRHLATCPGCRTDAARLLAATSELDRWLGSAAGGPDTERVLAAVEGAAAPRRGRVGATGAGSHRQEHARDGVPSRRPTPRPTPALRWGLASALAAGMVGVLVLGGDPDRRPPDDIGAPDRGSPVPTRVAASTPPPSPDLDLEVPSGTDAAVFTTADPDITVIWLMGGDR